MAIKLSCPSCRREAKLVNSFWGKNFKCKGCGEMFCVSREVVHGFAHSKKEPPARYAKCPGCAEAVLVIDGMCPLCQATIDSSVERCGLSAASRSSSVGGQTVQRPARRAGQTTKPTFGRTPTPSTMDNPGRPAAQGLSNRTLIIIGSSLVVLILGTTVVVTVLNSRDKSERRKAELLDLSGQMEGIIAQSVQLSATFQYDQALDCLRLLENEVATCMDEELERKYWAAIAKVSHEKQDYKSKLRRGYVVFEGELVPEDQLNQIRKQRKAERREAAKRQKAEEKRRQEEEARRREMERQAELRRQKQERLVAAAALKEMAFQMSQEFVKRQLKAPSSARFPSFSNSDVQVSYDDDEQKYTVMAWVEAQNPFGVYLRLSYVCILWPTGGDLWESSLTSLS